MKEICIMFIGLIMLQRKGYYSAMIDSAEEYRYI